LEKLKFQIKDDKTSKTTQTTTTAINNNGSSHLGSEGSISRPKFEASNVKINPLIFSGQN